MKSILRFSAALIDLLMVMALTIVNLISAFLAGGFIYNAATLAYRFDELSDPAGFAFLEIGYLVALVVSVAAAVGSIWAVKMWTDR